LHQLKAYSTDPRDTIESIGAYQLVLRIFFSGYQG
jgi:hypothetical protein